MANLGVLAIFKYYDFFQASTNGLARGFHVPTSLPVLHILLAIGISFYTFQSMSYTIDVYRGQVRAADQLSDCALFVDECAWFPRTGFAQGRCVDRMSGRSSKSATGKATNIRASWKHTSIGTVPNAIKS